MSDTCYNHDNVRADFRCFDCKPDFVVRFCKDCHDQVHSLQVFRLHKTQPIEKAEQRKLSQDVADLETLVAVENNLLKDVLTTLQYTEQQEREMLRDIIIKTEKRLHDIQQCHEKIDKAIHYLNKVSSIIKLCSGNNEMQDASSANLTDKPISNDLKAAGDEQAGASSLAEEFPVLIRSSLSKKGGFWMIRSDSAGLKRVAQIENKLKEHFASNSLTGCSTTIKEGTICVATNEMRTEFWRVRIVKLCKGLMVTVYYLDHGQQESIPIRCIFDIPPDIKQISYQAMECCLFPYSEYISLPYEAKWCFKDLIHGKDIKAKICSKVIFPEGNTLFHVQLTSIEPPQVNINQKVADLMLQQELIKQERDVFPKEAPVQHQTEEPKQEDNSLKPLAQANVSIATTESHGLKKADEEQTVTTASPPEHPSVVSPERSSPNFLAPMVPNDEQEKELPSLTILTNTDRVVPGDVPRNPGSDLQGPKEQAREVKPFMTIPEYVPIGFLNEQMYDRIFKECKANFALVKSLIINARFFIVHVDDFQLTEAMKKKTWCCIDDALCKNINKVYRDQVSRGTRHPLFLVFFSRIYVIGLVRIVSPCHASPHCTVLGRGLLWSHCCYGEFRIDLYNANRLSTKMLESEAYLRQFTRENIVGKELKWERGCEIIQKYEKIKRKSSVLDDACRMYSNDPRKDFVSSQENLSEGDQPGYAKGLYNLQDVETKLLDRDNGQTRKERRRRSMEDVDEFLAGRSSDRKEKETVESENWDLEAEPVRVAEIYSNITSNTAGQDTTSETTTEEEQKPTLDEKEDNVALRPSESEALNECSVDNIALLPSESEALNECSVDNIASRPSESGALNECSVDNSSSANVEAITNELKTTEDETVLSVSAIEDSRMKQGAVNVSPEVQIEDIPKASENEASKDYSNLELMSDSSMPLTASENSETNVNREYQSKLETEVINNDQRNEDVEEKSFSGKEELPETGEDQFEVPDEVVTTEDEQEIMRSEDVSAMATRDVTVEDDERLEDSKMSLTFEDLHKSKVVDSENVNGNVISFPKQENTLEEDQTTQHAGVGNGVNTEIKKVPPQERHPSYLHHVLQLPKSQPEEDFYVVNPPSESSLPTSLTSCAASEPLDYAESEDNGTLSDVKPIIEQEDDIREGMASPESIDSELSSDITPTTTLSSDCSTKRASPENIDGEPSSDISPPMQSHSAANTTEESYSDWLTRNADVISDEKESSDSEESMGFLPVEPGFEYRVILMSRPNEDNIFCARIYRNEEEEKAFKHFCKRLNAAMEKRNEKVTNVFVMKNCCFKLKKSGGYRRVLIKKLLGKGKVLIQNIDMGFAIEAPITDLRELESEFQVSFPPQSFECRILHDISKQDKMKFSNLNFMARNKRRGYNTELEIFVKSIVGEIAEVNILRVYENY